MVATEQMQDPDFDESGSGASDMSAFEADLETDNEVVDELADSDDRLAKASNELEEAKEDLARARADYYNLQQDYNGYVRRSKNDVTAARKAGQVEVLDALLSVLDDVDGARTAGELAGPFQSVAEKLEQSLATGFSLERFGAVGDIFDPEIHEALIAQTNADVEVPVVAQILQPGYRVEDKVIRPAKVMVDNPE